MVAITQKYGKHQKTGGGGRCIKLCEDPNRISILIHGLKSGEECHHLLAKAAVSAADEALVVARRIMAQPWILLVLGQVSHLGQRRPQPWAAATILHLLRQEEPLRITLS